MDESETFNERIRHELREFDGQSHVRWRAARTLRGGCARPDTSQIFSIQGIDSGDRFMGSIQGRAAASSN
jgi:hypothetical protein